MQKSLKFCSKISFSNFIAPVLVRNSVNNCNCLSAYSTNLSAFQNQQNMGVSLQDLVKRLESLSPLKLAESWDNVGLLVEPDRQAVVSKVLLTIDLTEEVVQEAINVGAQMIVSYHPNIFRPLKTVTQSSWKERIIVQCIKNNIAVFSPHTSWDAMEGGVNDWLASVFIIQSIRPLTANPENAKVGMGRYVNLKEPVALKEIIQNVKEHIGIPHLRLGLAKNKTLDCPISTVALCAGSGASLLNGVNADLYLTGEMLHHDVLEATQNGISVILCNHSDSERGFLKNLRNLLNCENLSLHVSQVDKDCVTTV